jgi:hypothetical protein
VPVILMNLRLPIADFPVVIVFVYAAAMCSLFRVALQWRRLKIKEAHQTSALLAKPLN